METIDYKFETYQIYRSSCTTCKHGFDKEKFTCKAFPVEIPDEILSGDNLHKTPVKDQGNDITYVQDEKFNQE